MTLTLDRVNVTLVRISGQSLPTYQIRSKFEKVFVDEGKNVHTDRRMDTPDISRVGWLEFNVPFQHKYGYIRDERSGVDSYLLTQ